MWNSGLGGMVVGRQRWSLSNVRYRYSLPSRVKRKLKKHWSVEKKNANFKEWRVNPWFSTCLGSFLAACFFHGMLESQWVVTVTLFRSYSIWSLVGILSKWTPCVRDSAWFLHVPICLLPQSSYNLSSLLPSTVFIPSPSCTVLYCVSVFTAASLRYLLKSVTLRFLIF